MLNALHQLTIEILLYRKINTLNFEPKMSILKVILVEGAMQSCTRER